MTNKADMEPYAAAIIGAWVFTMPTMKPPQKASPAPGEFQSF